MPLEVLGAIVVIGLLGVYVLMRVMRFDRRARLINTEMVCEEWAADNPTAPAIEVLLADSGQVALVRSKRGWGVLWIMGLDTASHALGGATVAAHSRGLELKWPDFSAPSLVLELTPDEVTDWQKQIEEAV